MATPWRPAKSLDKLLEQVNAAYPKRSKKSDGTIGDTAHAATVSDHNPDRRGIVRARDLTDDPANGLDASALADVLIASRDPRIKYVISDRRIASSYPVGGVPAWRWRHYAGDNPHTSHVHVSVVADDRADSVKAWTIKPATAPATPLLKFGSTGPAVKRLQAILGVKADGQFGAITRAAVIRFQRASHLSADGIVGPLTWKALNR